MKIYLITMTENPLEVMTLACRTCYSDLADEIKIFDENHSDNMFLDYAPNPKLVKEVLSRGHLSIAEHVSTTWLAVGVTRSLTHQLVRHRLASFSQQSLRYVEINTHKDFAKIPDTVKNKKLIEWYEDFYKKSSEYYEFLIKKGVKKEDARYLLPIGTMTNIMFTMNLRELMHFFNLRCCNRAQWEIRELARGMQGIMSIKLPDFKDLYGAKCEVSNQYCFDVCDKKAKSIEQKY